MKCLRRRKHPNQSEDGVILKWLWTPWPESVERKINVGKTIPKADLESGLGKQHEAQNLTALLIYREKMMNGSTVHDLCENVDDEFSWARRAVRSTMELCSEFSE